MIIQLNQCMLSRISSQTEHFNLHSTTSLFDLQLGVPNKLTKVHNSVVVDISQVRSVSSVTDN